MQSYRKSAFVGAVLLSVTFGVAPGVAAQRAPSAAGAAPSHALRELDSLIAKRPSDATVLARIAEVGPVALRHTYRQIPMSVADVRRRVVVDSVQDVVHVPADGIRPAPTLHEAGSAFIQGIATSDEQMLILLDADRLIPHELSPDRPASTAA